MPGVELTDEEESLRASIQLDPRAIKDPVAFQANANRVAELTRSLLARKAVPDHRLRYFTDPDFNVGGRGRSRFEQFKRTGNTEDEVIRHPHFLAYLKYFLQGPALPERAIDAFTRAVQECGHVTSGDVLPLGKLARTLTRELGLAPSQACEEFFKLALECGLTADTAKPIRDAVRNAGGR